MGKINIRPNAGIYSGKGAPDSDISKGYTIDPFFIADEKIEVVVKLSAAKQI